MTWDRLLSAERSRSAKRNPDDIRSEFAKDYHRIISSASFRRLQDKTQVFPLDRGDFVRTRLTHSLEVSSFAGSIGDTALARLSETHPEITPQVRADCAEILRCAGLIHDIGNPPFGHFGEFAIREWFTDNLPRLSCRGKSAAELLTPQQHADLEHFEGNAQALRVLTKLHFMVDSNGMNLTYALLNTIIKYPVPSTGINKKSGDIRTKKMGYFAAEQQLYENITSSTGAKDCRYPLTWLLEAADDIAYKTADIEDAQRKGLLSYNTLLSELGSLTDKCRTRGESETLQKTLELLPHYLRNARQRGMPSVEENAVQNFLVRVQSMMIYAAADSFVKNYDLIMRGELRTELLADSPVRVLSDALSDIACRYAFNSKEILRIELSVSEMVNCLLERLSGAALRFETPQEKMTDSKLINVISENYVKICRSGWSSPSEEMYSRLMLVTDYVCGMTDGFARQLFRELRGEIR
ncbi:MAG: deoxyguanosinetriphosphate triphosphohydrolase [Oscillospiraceae bacterium]|nr:deoxyguanosinetriphosphate triphosphohydrolase [Oscillospiraceae bacterium]